MKKELAEKLANKFEQVYNDYYNNGELSNKDKQFINNVYKIMYNNDKVTDNIENIDDLEEFLIELYNLYVENDLTWVDGFNYVTVDNDKLKQELKKLLINYLTKKTDLL